MRQRAPQAPLLLRGNSESALRSRVSTPSASGIRSRHSVASAWDQPLSSRSCGSMPRSRLEAEANGTGRLRSQRKPGATTAPCRFPEPRTFLTPRPHRRNLLTQVLTMVLRRPLRKKTTPLSWIDTAMRSLDRTVPPVGRRLRAPFNAAVDVRPAPQPRLVPRQQPRVRQPLAPQPLGEVVEVLGGLLVAVGLPDPARRVQPRLAERELGRLP